jgi:peptide/nickel transport system permease protein
MRLQRYILLRLLYLAPVVVAVIVVNFLLIHLAPGDVATTLAGDDANPEYIAHIRNLYGLDRPFLEQLWTYLSRVAQGDLGVSFRSREPVLVEIMRRVPATLLLVGTSLGVAVLVGTACGALIARRPGGKADTAASAIAIALYSVPVFWVGLMLVLLFGVNLRWLPVSGMYDLMGPREGWRGALNVARHLVLPTLALSTVWIGQYLLLARTSVIQALAEPYVTTARAVGFPERTILLHHALRNAMLPLVTVLGLQMGLVLTGAVLTETVFSWPGLGRMIYEAILTRDTPVIMGAYVVMSFTVAIASLVTDIAYAALDPRVEL